MNRSLKRRVTRTPGQQGPELENHFILRVPQPQAKMLRELLRSNQSSNIKDQLSIQLDYSADNNDMRNGIITVDTMMYKARLVDLPTIIESWKTIDNKNFYKTADICQMLMVRDADDAQEEEESKKKKKDHPNRVDKKYLWPHGYTPPLKNVRKRRFRKMLRKKILELPEIEKEVKRLLRADEEALNVKWEVLREDEEKLPSAGGSAEAGGLTKEGMHQQDRRTGAAAAAARDNAPANLDEQLFGEMVSSSEDEVGPTINIMDEDEDSRFSVEDSRLSEQYMEATNSPHTTQMSGAPFGGDSSHPLPLTSYPGHLPLPPVATSINQAYPTEFNPSMFASDAGNAGQVQGGDEPSYQELSNVGSEAFTQPMADDASYDNFDVAESRSAAGAPASVGADEEDSSDLRDGGEQQQLGRLEAELAELENERAAHEAHMNSLDNLALKTRFLTKLHDMTAAIQEKQAQVRRLRASLGL